MDSIFYLDDIFFEIIKYLDFNDIMKLKKINEKILVFCDNNSDLIMKNLLKNLNYKLYENNFSFNFNKKNITTSITKSINVNNLVNAIKISRIFKNTQC